MYRVAAAFAFLMLATSANAALPPTSQDLAEAPQRCWIICDPYECDTVYQLWRPPVCLLLERLEAAYE